MDPEQVLLQELLKGQREVWSEIRRLHQKLNALYVLVLVMAGAAGLAPEAIQALIGLIWPAG